MPTVSTPFCPTGKVWLSINRAGEVITVESQVTHTLPWLKGAWLLYTMVLLLCRDKIVTGSFDKTCKVRYRLSYISLQISWCMCVLKLWSSETGGCFHTFRGHTSEVVGVSFNPQSTLVATASMDHTAKIWSVKTGEELHTLAVSEEGRGWGVVLIVYVCVCVCV